MEVRGSSETLANIFYIIRSYVPEDNNLQEFYNLYSHSYIIGILKRSNKSWAGHVAFMVGIGNG
jgi:hypothetical protein